jgi:hypothetical protein
MACSPVRRDTIKSEEMHQKLGIGEESDVGCVSHANPKYFLFHLSHRIFGCMHVALNVIKTDN